MIARSGSARGAPRISAAIGHGMREFKDSISGGDKRDDEDDEEITIRPAPGAAAK